MECCVQISRDAVRLMRMAAAGIGLAALAAQGQTPPAASVPAQVPLFSPQERALLVAYWNTPGRIQTSPPANFINQGLFQVRPTAGGSQWMLKYQIALGAAGAPPTQTPASIAAADPQHSDWRQWVAARLAADAWNAHAGADAENAALHVGTGLGLEGAQPPAPGPIPPDLLAACGDPPPFAEAAAPLSTTITFDNGMRYTYTDHTNVPLSYAYYRFAQGVDTGGTPVSAMPRKKLDSLFAAAGLTPSQTRAAEAVSRLEGGFDAINTYDTGYVSIGFLQFITAADGKGDLMHVLQQEKSDNPAAFLADFHRFGIDVTPQGVLDVVDPATGAELTGADAVMEVIADKRLTAVFQRAGQKSKAFQVAQIETAQHDYWPASLPVTVTVNGQTITGVVSDVVHSEAGLTTLYDRAVNRGSINPFPAVLQQLMTRLNLTSFVQASLYERDLIKACQYRTNFLKDPALSQPPAPPALPSSSSGASGAAAQGNP